MIREAQSVASNPRSLDPRNTGRASFNCLLSVAMEIIEIHLAQNQDRGGRAEFGSVSPVVTTPSAEADGFLEDACLSPTTLPSTGLVQASRHVCGGDLHPCRSFTEPQGDAIQGRPTAPIGLVTDQALRGARP
jgi:hypothetical protein